MFSGGGGGVFLRISSTYVIPVILVFSGEESGKVFL